MVRDTFGLLVLTGLAACTPEPECQAEIPAWEDGDGDGFGDAAAPLGEVCRIEDGMSEVPTDCDDDDPEVAPGAKERCDGVDEDCDGERDEGFDRDTWYRDDDGDGFGASFGAELACERPKGGDWVANADDCDDGDAGRNPDAQEVCGGGDEDCDGLPDDSDPSVDPSTYSTFYRDRDRDGLGSRAQSAEACALPQGAADNDRDCDDGDPLVGRYYWYEDADRDGYGNPEVISDACVRPDGYVADNTDCDDTDRTANVDLEWYDDLDGDGYGGGPVVAIQCRSPYVGLIADDSDCDDTDDRVNPDADDACFDGIDTNCDGTDNCRTCQEWHETDPNAPSGVYDLDLASGTYPVWCDMETDGGGWTLVSNALTPSDYAAAWYTDLSTLNNSDYWYWYTSGIWDGMREITTRNSDVRVSCGPDADDLLVDLSFYDIHWYREWTTSTWDGDSCFNEPGGYDQPAPARRNNLTGDTRPLGDDWDSGALRGEDWCWDGGDFAIDFDNRGKGNSYYGWGSGDSTSWGQADYTLRCGTMMFGGATYWIWFRE